MRVYSLNKFQIYTCIQAAAKCTRVVKDVVRVSAEVGLLHKHVAYVLHQNFLPLSLSPEGRCPTCNDYSC